MEVWNPSFEHLSDPDGSVNEAISSLDRDEFLVLPKE